MSESTPLSLAVDMAALAGALPEYALSSIEVVSGSLDVYASIGNVRCYGDHVALVGRSELGAVVGSIDHPDTMPMANLFLRSVRTSKKVADAFGSVCGALGEVLEMFDSLYSGMAEDGEREVWDRARAALASAKG